MTTQRRSMLIVGETLQDTIDKLHELYLPINLNGAFYKTKVRALKKVDYILKHTDRISLQTCEFDELIRCSLSLLYFFGMRLKISRMKSKYWNWCGKRHFNKAETIFHKTLDFLHPERSETSIKLILTFFNDIELWSVESFVGQILEVVLYFDGGRTTLFNIMLTDIHYVMFHNVVSARHRMRILYELLKSSNWVIDRQKLLPFVTRLLDFFSYSINNSDSKIQAYEYLRKGFEVCLRRIFERVENQHRFLIISTMLKWFSIVNLNDDETLEFSSLLDHAAKLYIVGPYLESFRNGVFEHVMSSILGSSNASNSLIGCLLLQRFLDRSNNAPFLMAPTIYYEFSQVHLKIGKYDKADKSFFRIIREKLHKYILRSVRQHHNYSTNLKAVFSVICIMVLEVPCALTAAAAACMVMAIQDYAINAENLSATCRYWMHALVISIMSLICWVHRAPVLYRYVNQIISRRAKEAPQLNPPLMQFYNIGRHHVTWNKPTLFFEDWELRYGLWKHFQDSHQGHPQNAASLGKKIPTMDLRK